MVIKRVDLVHMERIEEVKDSLKLCLNDVRRDERKSLCSQIFLIYIISI